MYSGESAPQLKSPHRIACAVCVLAWKGVPGSSGRGGDAAWRAGFGVQGVNRARLRRALQCRVVLQVCRHHAHRAQRRVEHGEHAAHARHAAYAGIGRPGQGVMLHLRRREPRRDQVAEAPAPAVGTELVHRGAEEQRKTRQQRRQLRRLVAGRAGQRVVTLRDLLQAQHVEVSQAARLLDDALRADHAVQAAAPLGIPGDELHHPSRPGRCTEVVLSIGSAALAAPQVAFPDGHAARR